ncbi:Aspartate/methionine/tyrosine aminotransferase [Rhodoblastus acidophilus]|uniref:aspartate transaminase n=1 Tax=Rhodoblastus acidophilus TaxID=1074 RepID=A0A212PWT2_RHOAC|nr:aminotransferase class I/II-fold pyridoxal phosphate-dependent enzyme [Rhodoblastus acidophilus]PPQ34587.1 1-aminocyclopropane-1-carboxylate deaminase [Rhodoblastus acidophilus]RAI17730.1 1-aminocyclopropane-1-carboxylate deaminase [Rhodoblastus acidophilus]SNB51486.1 Aspartate/methionine/tyrosine aminotransferase [Rhodoblastus acidophilus]
MSDSPFLTPARRAAIAPFLAMDVMREAAQLRAGGRDIIQMEVGAPCAGPPRRAREAVMAALDGRAIGYTDALGQTSLRQRIARHYRETYGVEIDPERVAVTTGSSGGFIMAFLALFDAGARVAINCPSYPCYRNILGAFGVETVELRGVEGVTPEQVEAADDARKLDGLLLMNPSNPTGALQSDESMRKIAQICEKRGIKFISDEIYHGLTYERPAQTALAFSQAAVVVNSFSKYYCMTGWRVGWLVVPPGFSRVIERLQQSLAISPPTLSQIAAEAAFDATEELEAVKAGYARNRRILLDALTGMGFGLAPADGAFYVYADLSRFSDNSLEFCKNLLERAGVAATPGVDFDPSQGRRALRFSYAGVEVDMIEAMRRLKTFLGR